MAVGLPKAAERMKSSVTHRQVYYQRNVCIHYKLFASFILPCLIRWQTILPNAFYAILILLVLHFLPGAFTYFVFSPPSLVGIIPRIFSEISSYLDTRVFLPRFRFTLSPALIDRGSSARLCGVPASTHRKVFYA